MTKKPLRLGIIGAGEITRILLPLLREYPIEVTALTDKNPGAARSLAAEFPGIEVLEDAADLIASPLVDAVFVATPPYTHAPLFRQVIEGGKHLIGEKPWVMNTAEALEIEHLAKAHPELKIGCCATRCSGLPAAHQARKLIEENAIGKLRFVRMTAAINPPRPRDQLPRWKNTPSATPGGVSADWLVYELEWLRGTLGARYHPLSVHAVFDHWGAEGLPFDTSYQISIQCADDLKILITRTAQIGPKEDLVELRGETGGIDAPFTPISSIQCLTRYSLDAERNLVTETVAGTEGNWPWNLVGPLVDFAQAIAEDRQPMANAASQVIHHRVLDAVYRSARENRVVEVPQPIAEVMTRLAN